jgi:hypothetical protein
LFAAADMLLPMSNDIKNCIDSYGNTTQILRQMAQTGFAPVDRYDDPAVKMIVRWNIGGIVQRGKSENIGLPKSIWNDYPNVSYGLVLAPECARIVVAEEVLAQEAKEAILEQEAKEAILEQEAKEAILEQEATESQWKFWWKRLT